MKTFTKEQFSDYVLGWLESQEYHANELSMGNIKAALNNALVAIEDGNDGIVDYVERREYLKSLKDK
jgi:hypothetical protein